MWDLRFSGFLLGVSGFRDLKVSFRARGLRAVGSFFWFYGWGLGFRGSDCLGLSALEFLGV